MAPRFASATITDVDDFTVVLGGAVTGLSGLMIDSAAVTITAANHRAFGRPGQHPRGHLTYLGFIVQ